VRFSTNRALAAVIGIVAGVGGLTQGNLLLAAEIAAADEIG
jgi:hypothetical protein